MKHIISLLLFIFAATTSWAENIVATDTIALTVNKVQDEPDPNNKEYCFSLFGTDDTSNYKIQIDYKSDNMYGTFTDSDFDLQGSGKSFNYIRSVNGSKFWSFKHLDATVSNINGGTQIDINGLISVYGSWRRVLASAYIAPPAPKDTICVDLGHVSVIPNTYLGYTLLEAKNDEYSLAFGLSGYSELKAGTYYRTELLRPEFVHLPSDTITSEQAQMVITNGTDGVKNLQLDLISTDNILYSVSMNTAAVEASDTVDVACKKAKLNDLVAMYNMYQMVGESTDYQVAIAVRPGVIENSELIVPEDSIDLSFTQILKISEQKLIRVQNATASIEIDSTHTNYMLVKAALLGTDGTLYNVTMPFGGSSLPEAADTTFIDCGNQVGRIDYTKGAGWIGLVLGNDDADVHVTAYNGLQMKGTLTSDLFDYTGSYVTTYLNNDEVIRFSDVQLAELRMDSIGNTVRIELDVITVNNRMYCFRANMQPMKCLTGETIDYSVDAQNQTDMVAIRTEQEGGKADYHLQFQRYDGVDEDGMMTGNYEVWDFRFTKDKLNSIAGEYGYAAGTLQEGCHHFIFENGSEVLLGVLAGKLTITPEAEVETCLYGEPYKTHLYSVNAQLSTENGKIYNVSGNNFLLCIDDQTGLPAEITEGLESAIRDILAERSIKVRKVMRNGVISIETANAVFDTNGKKIK